MEFPPPAFLHASPTLQTEPMPSPITPQLVALGPSPIKTYISTGIYYLTYYLSLHHIWFCIYRLHSDADAGSDSDLENASPTSRQCWTETVKRMTSVWTLIITVSSTVVIMLSVAFLQIDDVWDNIYPRTCAFVTLILSFASLIASGILIASALNLDSVGKFEQWEIASQNPTTPSSVDVWACLALPLTLFSWSAAFFLIALFSSMWTRQGAHSTEIYTGTSMMDFAATSIVVLCLVLPFYRLHQFLTK